MKTYVKSDSYFDQSVYSGSLSDISYKLQEVQSLCGKLEDFYWGEDVVDDIDKCYNFVSKALACIDRASTKI